MGAALTAVFAKYAFPYDWSWLESLLFGSMLSATDPVAVIALLHEVTLLFQARLHFTYIPVHTCLLHTFLEELLTRRKCVQETLQMEKVCHICRDYRCVSYIFSCPDICKTGHC